MNWYSMSDGAIIRELGSFIKEMRLKKNYTQNDLALKAGMHRVTLSEFEQGERGSLTAFVQLLRALDELETLNAFVRTDVLSPIAIAKLEAKKKKRASVPRQEPLIKKPAGGSNKKSTIVVKTKTKK